MTPFYTGKLEVSVVLCIGPLEVAVVFYTGNLEEAWCKSVATMDFAKWTIV